MRLVAEVDLSAIRGNVAAVRATVGPAVQVMAVVKADGYGHGAAESARAAVSGGATWLGVATVAEGAELRPLLPSVPICVFSPLAADEAEDAVRCRLTPFVGDLPGARALADACRRLGAAVDVHLEVDTGMGRSGVLPCGAGALAAEIDGLPGLRLSGIATHFPCAEADRAYTLAQLEGFDVALRATEAAGARLEHVHSAASAGLLLYPAARQTMVRPGLLVYGLVPSLPPGVDRPDVRPALSLKARVLQVRDLPAGHSISYARTHVLSRPSRVAVLSVGYGDGYPRELSGRGVALVGGRRVPILGRVCMDVTMVDVTDVRDVEAGDEAVLIGRQGPECIRAEEIASLIGTTEHDVTTRLTSRVVKRYTES